MSTWLRRTLKCIAALSLLACIAVFFMCGRNIPFEKQWPLYEALRTTASIVFAVVGAWMAIIFPDRLKFAVRHADQPAEAAKAGGPSKLFSPAIHSTAVLACVLIIGLVAPMIKQWPWALTHLAQFRGISYTTLGILTLWQLWAVVLTLIPADMVKSRVDRETEKAERIVRLQRNAQGRQAVQQAPEP